MGSRTSTSLASLCMLGACVRPSDASAVPSAPPAPTAATAATALANTFAPEIVGAMVPAPSRVPKAGEYAMSLAMRFTTFITTEMRVDANVKGALRLTLAPDGTASVCLGARNHRTTNGQFRYQPPEKREYRESDDLRLIVLAGQWSIVDGTAIVDFDRIGWNTCDVAKATSVTTSQLRCIAIDPTERIPSAGLACEASERSELLALGMPMMATLPDEARSSPRNPPSGRHFILGAPGVHVDVDQDRRADVPTFTVKAATVTLVEAEYRRAPSPKPQR